MAVALRARAIVDSVGKAAASAVDSALASTISSRNDDLSFVVAGETPHLTHGPASLAGNAAR